MLVQTGGLSAFTNDFLRQKYAYVSQDVDSGSIVQVTNSGRDGRGGITFTTGNDANAFAYDLYVQDSIAAADTQIFGIALRQTTTQHAAGGRLLTLIDGGEDIFGETTQIGINVMADGTLQAVRANAAGTGVVLQTSQLTVLGQSSTAIDATDTEFVVIEIFHDSAVGSVTATFYDNVGTIKGTWTLNNVNTAISGRNQSNSFCYGGYASSDGATRTHQDLQAVISDLYIVNNIVNPDDSRDPVASLGDRKPLMSLPDSAGAESEWVPTPTQANYLNVNEVPPNEGTTENSTNTVAATDTLSMQDEAGTQEVVVAYSAFLQASTPAECGASGDPATFEAFVYTEQTTPGEVHTSANDPSACNLTDFISRRAQSVCTISANGEKVTFKLSNPDIPNDAYYVGLSPLDAPPRLQTPAGPSYFASAAFHPKVRTTTGFSLADNINTTAIPGAVSYDLPFFQPWQGLAADTQDMMDSAGDYFQFQLLNSGIGADIGLVDNSVIGAPFNPYTSELIAFHFREDIEGSPYYWIGESFARGSETVYALVGNPMFKIVRNDPNIELYEGVTLRETFTPGAMPTHLNPFAFLGRWGFTSPLGYIKQPGIVNAKVQIGGSDCCPAVYVYAMLATSWDLFLPTEMQQWGIQFTTGFAEGVILDPGSTHGPFPLFGYTSNTRMEFSLEGGNVVLRIYDYDYLDGITDVGGVGTYTYTVPYANTNDFALQSVLAVGPPDFPNSTLEYNFTDATANQPLRLVFTPSGNNGDVVRGLNEISFTFTGTSGFGPVKAVMLQDSSTRLGTEIEPPTTQYRYKQSMLASTPADGAITTTDFNDSQHGYERTE